MCNHIHSSAMKVLVVETSSECALLACLKGTILLCKRQLSGGSELSKMLGVEVKKLLDLFPPPYDRVVVGIGPGSFTGTRVGAAMANALAFGWNIPLYTVSSLISFGPGTVAVDARMGGIYVQEEFTSPKLLSLSEAAEWLPTQPNLFSPHPEKILFRIPGLSIEKRRPNPLLMLEKALPASQPLHVHYVVSV